MSPISPTFLRRRGGVTAALATLFVLALAWASGPACEIPDRPIVLLDVPDLSGGSGVDVIEPPTGRQLGEPCDAATDPCRPGLACVDGVCEPDGSLGPEAPCVASAECGSNLFCSLFGQCLPAGAGDIGDPCATAADCKKGLWCELVGFSGRCAASGEGSASDDCTTTADCLAGLVCMGGRCEAGNPVFNPAMFFAGVECAPDETHGAPFRVLFEVPRGGALPEFYRLPTPNDIRTKNGKLDLTGFPTPGPGAVGVDLVERVVAAAEADLDGWSTNPTVMFRFSAPMDMNTITNHDAVDGDGKVTKIAAVHMVDIDPDSDAYAERIPVGWSAGARAGSRRKYHCQNWLVARPAWERPLAGGRTYAVIVTNDVLREVDEDTGAGGERAAQDSDFAALLADAPPADPNMARAWTAYTPLRNYFASEGIDPSTVAGAAVFTTHRPRAAAEGIRAAVRAAQPPTLSQATLCDAGITSPCDDGLEGDAHVRGCFAADPAFHEIHGKVRLPVFQNGEPPYLRPEDGGDIERDASGQPTVVRFEEVCFALTIPKGAGIAMPEEGWPVAVYSHGTGGTFRNHVTNGTAAALSRLDLAGDEPLGVAVLGIEGVLHGTRKGDSELPPDELFFNAFNPRGSRGNVLQGAADQHALTWLLQTVTIPETSSPTGEAIRFAPGQVLYIGHSQGGTVGMPYLAFEPDVRGAVLSGTGGGLTMGLLKKTSPQDIASGIKGAIQDEDINENHPVLGLLQLYFDAVDSLNYAGGVFFDNPPDIPGRHVLQTYGQGDTYTPPETMRFLGSAMRLTVAEPVLDDVSGVHKVAPPIEDATWWTHNKPVMAVMVQAAKPGSADGHFVLFEDAGIQRQFRYFVETMIRQDLPVVPAR